MLRLLPTPVAADPAGTPQFAPVLARLLLDKPITRQLVACDRSLRAPHHRPRHRGAEPRYKRASFHSMTSSARASSEPGTARPSMRAVWWLMTSSNLDDCITGKSAGKAWVQQGQTSDGCKFSLDQSA